MDIIKHKTKRQVTQIFKTKHDKVYIQNEIIRQGIPVWNVN